MWYYYGQTRYFYVGAVFDWWGVDAWRSRCDCLNPEIGLQIGTLRVMQNIAPYEETMIQSTKQSNL